jgi:hypothetical protein
MNVHISDEQSFSSDADHIDSDRNGKVILWAHSNRHNQRLMLFVTMHFVFWNMKMSDILW